MRTLSVVFAALVAGLVLGGCGSPADTAAPSAVSSSPAAGVTTTTPPAAVDTTTTPPAGGDAPSTGKLPGISITGPTPCLTGQQHFDTDQDRVTPQVCLRVGAALDLTTMRPERSLVTQVTSSDPAVLACGAPRPTVCQAKKAGQSIVTATDGGGEWRVAVFVGR